MADEEIELGPDREAKTPLEKRQSTSDQLSLFPPASPPPTPAAGEIDSRNPATEAPVRHPVFERALEILRETLPSPAAVPTVDRAPLPDVPNPSPEPPPPPAPAPPLTVIPARMLNEFVYCPRLFYYEFVEGVFVESADTIRGKTLHRRVDSGTGDLPPAKVKKPRVVAAGTLDLPLGEAQGDPPLSTLNQPPSTTPDVIHSRSVQMGSERLGVTA